jgi:hypothetical protein
MVEILGLLIVAAVALYVAWPLLWRAREAGLPAAGDPFADLASRRDTLYREIADLDFDYRVGKVEDDDYRLQREDYLEEAAVLLQQLDGEMATGTDSPRAPGSVIEEELEAEIRQLRSRNGRR